MKMICLLQPHGSDPVQLVRFKEKTEPSNPEAFYNGSLSFTACNTTS